MRGGSHVTDSEPQVATKPCAASIQTAQARLNPDPFLSTRQHAQLHHNAILALGFRALDWALGQQSSGCYCVPQLWHCGYLKVGRLLSSLGFLLVRVRFANDFFRRIVIDVDRYKRIQGVFEVPQSVRFAGH